MRCMSATDEQLRVIRKAFGAWLLREIASRDMDRPEFIQRIGYQKSTVSRWINGEALPAAPALVEIARVLRCPPDIVLYHAAGLDAYADAVIFQSLNLPPDLSRGESRLVEHLAWGVRHWREEQNAAGEPGDEDVA